MGDFDLDGWRARVGHRGPTRVNADTLEALHRAQAYAIPFENFDILLGRGITLAPESLFAKLVQRRRGGYCFELNGLFLMALRAAGFEARPLLARVHVVGEPTGRGHQLSLVTINGRDWIADVGFGGNPLRAPIPLELDRIAINDGCEFRLTDVPPFGRMLQSRVDGIWKNIYSFDLEHVCAGDIAYGNHFTSTHPSSFFTFARVAALPTPNGRVTLLNETLRCVGPDGEREERVAEGEPYLDALRTHFGIELDAPYEALRPLA